jgi:hypothetical protein
MTSAIETPPARSSCEPTPPYLRTLGKVMRFNADYILAGRLANEVRVSTPVGGKQFTIPPMERAHTLS